MRRLILSTPPDDAGRLCLGEKDFRYLVRVLRKTEGDTFRALLPDGREELAEIVAVDKNTIQAILRPNSASASADKSRAADAVRRLAVNVLPPIVLIQALPKAQKMDLIVRQATEAGVSLILPFIAEHSVSRPEAGRDSERKRERWERIVKEARQQSGSDVATKIREPLSLAQSIAAWQEFAAPRGTSVAVFLHQDPLAQGSLHGYLSDDPRTVAVAVGPEGGFSLSEANTLSAARFLPVLLGENVLRTETAAVFALAAMQVILLEKTSWIPKTPYCPESSAFNS